MIPPFTNSNDRDTGVRWARLLRQQVYSSLMLSTFEIGIDFPFPVELVVMLRAKIPKGDIVFWHMINCNQYGVCNRCISLFVNVK